MTEKPNRKVGVAAAPSRDWRRVHHSPLFWVGVVMFMLAILTYVFSEDLSLRPRRHPVVREIDGAPSMPP